MRQILSGITALPTQKNTCLRRERTRQIAGALTFDESIRDNHVPYASITASRLKQTLTPRTQDNDSYWLNYSVNCPGKQDVWLVTVRLPMSGSIFLGYVTLTQTGTTIGGLGMTSLSNPTTKTNTIDSKRT
jgi:hypothetical protein